jgi:hypothetical protein
MSNHPYTPFSKNGSKSYTPKKYKTPNDDSNFTTVKNTRKNNTNNKKLNIPEIVLQQRELRRKNKYSYHVATNGNVENNSTIYVYTSVAHPHQVETQFKEAIDRAKKMSEVFGNDFECDFQVNVVRQHTGQYVGYSFVDVTNPKFYYALLGYNVDGSDRAEYIDDPNWIPPKVIPKVPREHCEKIMTTANLFTETWAEISDDDRQPSPPKIRRELPPLITLDKYEYDEQQKLHLLTDVTHGDFSVSPAFVIPGVKEDYDDCSLYVSEVPAVDYDFLYALFTRYARSSSPAEDDHTFFPRINIRQCNKDGEVADGKTGIFAIVEYAHPLDAAFSMHMIKKIRANYKGEDISIPVRYAFKNKNKEKKPQYKNIINL